RSRQSLFFLIRGAFLRHGTRLSPKLIGGSRLRAGTLESVQRMFMAHGGNEVFTRIATRRQANDVDAQHGFKEGLEKAALARKLGIPLNPELGLWAVYGDISHQPGPDFSDYPQISLPGPWSSLSITEMTKAMREYGAQVAKQILGKGAEVNVWDLGNEVEFGVAGVAVRSFTESTAYWSYSAPDAVDPEIGRMTAYQLFTMPDRTAWLQQHLWPHMGAIFAAVAAGIKSIDPHARFSTHTSTVALLFPDLLTQFWQSMNDAGFDIDELGVSYYPTSSGGSLASFQATATALKEKYGKKVFVAECGYPSGTMEAPFAWNSPLLGYPQDQDGEYRFYRDLTAWGASTGVLSGVRPWAPDYAIGGWQPMNFFTPEGNVAAAEPALNAIRDGLASLIPPLLGSPG
ncbi:glycosyl hydrolase 53 family protein, partial [Pseudarthrobacter sp. NPDC092184]|uniref:glycosyl hydrolase 53 family protein n=1 Tax=Pseudarthrobacter sp. NPDC092184 TaxID=3364410 RepID=UPI0038096C32